MRVTVEYVAQVKNAAGIDSEEIGLAEKSTLKDLLSALVSRHDEIFRAVVLCPDGSMQSSILVAVNDKQILPDEQVSLHDHDHVMIITPMSGG